MKPYGYSVILCRNCNRTYGPRLVSENDFPPPLDEINLEDGVNVRVDARVDFGVTSSAMLSSAYNGTLAGKGPFQEPSPDCKNRRSVLFPGCRKKRIRD